MKPDYDEALSPAGRVIDSQLSEHQAEGMLEGYVLTGRHGFFASYESFPSCCGFYDHSTLQMVA